jgi:hypothetical protein
MGAFPYGVFCMSSFLFLEEQVPTTTNDSLAVEINEV